MSLRRFPDASDLQKGSRFRNLLYTAAAVAAAFLCLLVWRWEILDSPPYWDSAMGLFLEADFLAETGFDYRQLIFEEKRFLEGGKGVYLNSVLPTFVAVLMKICPSPRAVIICYRLFNLVCASVILVVVYLLSRANAGRYGAFLLALALVSVPVFAAQVDMLGMDIPMLAVGIVAVKLLFDGRYVFAASVSLVSFFFKSTAQALTAAMAVYCILLLIIRGDRDDPRERRRLWLGLGMMFFALAVEIQLSSSIQALPTSEHEAFQPDLWQGAALLKNLWIWCPDIVVLFAVTWVLWSARLVTEAVHTLTRAGSDGRSGRVFEAMRAALERYRDTVFGWIVVFGMLLAFALIYSIPRYLVLPLTFLILIFGRVTMTSDRGRRLASLGLIGFVGFNYFNLDGRFYPSLEDGDPFDRRTGAILERSREYLLDHQANIRLIELLDRHYRDWAIVAPSPFVHFLSLPRLGYVREPLKGYSINTFTTPTFPSVRQLKDDPFQYLLFVWSQNRFMGLALASNESGGRRLQGVGVPYPEGRTDLSMIFRDETFGPLLAYYRVWPNGFSQEDIRNTYLAELIGGDAFMEVARRAYESGDVRAALTVYRQVLKNDPTNAEALARAGSMLFLLGDLVAARKEFERALAIDGGQPIAHNGLGALAAQKEDYSTAEVHFSRAIESLEGDEDTADKELLSETYRNLGLLLWKWGEAEGAISKLQAAIAVHPEYVLAYRDLGQLALEQGAPARARAAFEKALEIAPHDDLARLGFAIAAARDGKREAAREALAQLTTKDPRLLYQRGVILDEMLGAPDEAEASFRAALEELKESGEKELRATIHLQRGNMRLRQKDVSGAMDDFRKALSSPPAALDAGNNLAWILATYSDESIRNPDEALALAKQVCDSASVTRPGYLDTLAAAYARHGEWDLAIQTAERAARLAKSAGNPALEAAIRVRQQLYMKQEPYTESVERNRP